MVPHYLLLASNVVFFFFFYMSKSKTTGNLLILRNRLYQLRLRAFKEIGATDPIPYAKFSRNKEIGRVEKMIKLKRLLNALTSKV